MHLPHDIRQARAAQHDAARAVARHGLKHPLARALLTVAALAAAAAWEAGHHVHELHRTSVRADPPEPTDR